ncbi:MAG: hypothetical protein J7604_06725 [Sporocytophaga sp.]|uniref:hypothetical protein n=1 Tax=Sporocytophaga sp. TaxID=2231183 RepID=UPI001B298C5F|nr:hypothetical protein [Sporocytophaga sp.]MBO9699888.1 hypothetical protein [Sporocytophaga sp.]
MAPIANISFLPWVRQGVAARISEADTLGNSEGIAIERASLQAELEVKYKGLDDVTLSNHINKSIQIVGPGDVQNFSQKAIVRTEPKHGVSNYEVNGLPYIEFYEEDFLWRYTPAHAASSGANTKLRPWLALVVLEEDEFTIKPNPAGLSYISINQDAFDNAFPSEKDTWAYAHVQINNNLNDLAQPQQEVNEKVNANPDSAVSRLLCARKLKKNTGYSAFVIPAFEAGRLTGLGIKITGIKAQQESWRKGSMPASDKRPYDFPVYYQWAFRTADYGDFESLASMLKPIIMKPESGKMPMDIQSPGFNLSPQNNGTKVIGLEAALSPPDFKSDPWPAKENDNTTNNGNDINTIDKLRDLLNLSADLVDKNAVINSPHPFYNVTNLNDDPLVVPPVYGVWHALVERLGASKNPQWIEQLNLDFRNRAAAGLGTTVVKKYQEDFMNRAWQQVDKVNEANKKIEESLHAKYVNISLLKKHMLSANDNRGLILTNAVQYLIKSPGNSFTVQQEFSKSRIPNASKSAAFRKITRPKNKIEKASYVAAMNQAITLDTSRLIKSESILTKFNIDEGDQQAVRAATLKKKPEGALLTTDVEQLANKLLTDYNNNVSNLSKDLLIEIIEEEVVFANASKLKVELIAALNGKVVNNPEIIPATKDLLELIQNYPLQKNADGQVLVIFENNKFIEIFGIGIHAKSYGEVILKDSSDINTIDVKSIVTGKEIKSLVDLFGKFSEKMDSLPKVEAVEQFGDLENMSAHIYEKIDPGTTLKNKLASKIKIWMGSDYVPLPELKPIMVYPEFPEAVYTYLLEISKNFILPNIDKLPPNSITILENNQPFIEAFMAGMNHEMSRELLWREYPTDQRGSYFRQFWNIEDNLFADPDPEMDKESKLDIKKIHEWQGVLGSHNPRLTSANLVLVIRGDLFKKYPNTMVYAQQAEYNSENPSKPRKLKGGINSTITKFPLFKAEIMPDISLFGFNLNEDDARGERIESNNPSDANNKNPGWFFILKERPGQIRFGLDDFTDEHGNTDIMPQGQPDTWNDLSWEHLVNSKKDLETYHINFAKSVSPTNNTNQPKWGINSADMASILFQNPVLFARHAAEMLPEKE